MRSARQTAERGGPAACRRRVGRGAGARAFTLIELLTVVAILGILAAILIPGVGAARAAANRARTRVQFAGWTAAFEAYRQEYGRYPALPGGAATALVNLGAGREPSEPHWFHDALAGRHRDGSPLTDSAVGNRPHLRFLSFGEEDFVGPRDTAAGYNQPDELHLLRDSFSNTQIAVVIDANLDGLINATDLGADGLPGVVARDGRVAFRPADVLEGSGVRSGVIFYSVRPGASSDYDLITSWR